MATVEKIIINSVPLWDPNVWKTLQQKNFSEALKNLKNVLGSFTPDEWGNIEWEIILEGAPAFRGDLTQEEWERSVKDLILRAILETANSESLKFSYETLSPQFQTDFHKELSKAIPGETADEKLDWLKNHRPALYKIFSRDYKPIAAVKPPAQKTVAPSFPSAQFQTPPPPPPPRPPVAPPPPIPPAVKPVQQFRVPVDVGPILPELEKPETSGPKEVHYTGKTTQLSGQQQVTNNQ